MVFSVVLLIAQKVWFFKLALNTTMIFKLNLAIGLAKGSRILFVLLYIADSISY